MRVEHDYIEIVYGQGESDPRESEIVVKETDPDHKGMGLTKTTHFRLANVVHMLADGPFRRKAGRCTNGRFLDFEELAEEARLARRITAQPPHIAKSSTHDPNAQPEDGSES
jgi:hypothetical protein